VAVHRDIGKNHQRTRRGRPATDGDCPSTPPQTRRPGPLSQPGRSRRPRASTDTGGGRSPRMNDEHEHRGERPVGLPAQTNGRVGRFGGVPFGFRTSCCHCGRRRGRSLREQGDAEGGSRTRTHRADGAASRAAAARPLANHDDARAGNSSATVSELAGTTQQPVARRSHPRAPAAGRRSESPPGAYARAPTRRRLDPHPRARNGLVA